ncbi:YdiU family protein [Rhodobacterales bacterium HKCCE2091]|nr:YdiU family protein [Rhodobacterales bacterium HKCCE2091]
MTVRTRIAFDNSYARDLAGFYVPVTGDTAPAPRVLRLNRRLAEDLGLDTEALEAPEGASWLTGGTAPEGAEPLAMAYAGHQFGGFSPQLGDGRALLLGEVIDRDGHRRDIHLKGSGPTPFSRRGDGKAVLGPVLREYIVGEAMHALGIPTTRALAASVTGEQVMRNGLEPGAVLARVASSHLRVGTFQFFAARGETDRLEQLADYAIARHDPDLSGRDDRYIAFFARVRDRQARLVAQWMGVGFVHGVMNTDNMAISGETIDYGPCAFIDAYDPKAVFSSIDQFGRYAYANQPAIAQWNLARLAECLIELVNPDDGDAAIATLTEALDAFPAIHRAEWTRVFRAKLGLSSERDGDEALAEALLEIMAAQEVDFTRAFRALSGAVRGDDGHLRALFRDAAPLDDWLARYAARGAEEAETPEVRAEAMDRANPVYIPRNHKVEEALAAANAGDMEPFDRLLAAVTAPFETRPGQDAYALPAPTDFGPYTTYCGT